VSPCIAFRPRDGRYVSQPTRSGAAVSTEAKVRPGLRHHRAVVALPHRGAGGAASAALAAGAVAAHAAPQDAAPAKPPAPLPPPPRSAAADAKRYGALSLVAERDSRERSASFGWGQGLHRRWLRSLAGAWPQPMPRQACRSERACASVCGPVRCRYEPFAPCGMGAQAPRPYSGAVRR
jgi:hypothetical protein